MRPNIVWFGESVPMISTAEGLAYDADIFIIIGTSMVVYPAAGLVGWTEPETPIYVVDPNDTPLIGRKGYVTHIKKTATEGVTELVEKLLNQ